MINLKQILTSTLFYLLTVCALSQQAVTAETALQSYLNNEDTTAKWELIDSYQIDEVIAYSILLTSQTWQGIIWKHELIVFVPITIDYDGALLFITGSSIKDGIPKISKQNDATSKQMASLANSNRAVVALLKQVPKIGRAHV